MPGVDDDKDEIKEKAKRRYNTDYAIGADHWE